MLKLASYSKEFTPLEVARRAYNSEGVKAIGWNGYIVVKERDGFWTSYFYRNITKKLAGLEYFVFSTEKDLG